MPKTIVIFPDTNVFLQCKPLDQIKWAELSDATEIKILVTRPVQAEIDSHKGKGSGRLSKRARAASAMFKELLLSGKKIKTLSTNPQVTLQLRQDLKTDIELEDQLDYRERDDQLVGIAMSFLGANPDDGVFLLTGDSGPMASAELVGLAFYDLPASWLLAPETDEADKRFNKLEAELQRYQNSEPGFAVSVDPLPLEFNVTRYSALSSETVADLLTELEVRFPLATEFPGAPKPVEFHSSINVIEGIPKFVPPTEEEIERYQSETYPAWLCKAEQALNDLHLMLLGLWPQVTIEIGNVGGRPATNSLVTIGVSGSLYIAVPLADKPDEEKPLALPRPPAPPCGHWKRTPPLTSMSSLLNINESFVGLSLAPPTFHRPRALVPPDPNKFFYKSSRPEVPSKQIQLECEQWRHHISGERLKINVYTKDVGLVKGTIDVEVHATNLTVPFTKRIPISIRVVEESPLAIARNLIGALKPKSSLFKLAVKTTN